MSEEEKDEKVELTVDDKFHILLATNMTIGGERFDGVKMAWEELHKKKEEGDENGK